MSNLISVIIPVYNAENYLEKCVYSVCNQTYENLEIILIDDGSTDKSGQICDMLAQKDQRIKVTHKENGGPSSARNAGLDAATGDYIGFVDSDDHIETTMYEILYDLLKQNNSDISQIAHCKEFSNGCSSLYNAFCVNKILNNRKDIEYAFWIEGYISVVLWDKLFDKNLRKNIRANEDSLCDDAEFMLHVLNRSTKVVLSDKILYHQFQTPASITRNNYSIAQIYSWIYMAKYFTRFALHNYHGAIKNVAIFKACMYLISSYIKCPYMQGINKSEILKWDTEIISLFKEYSILVDKKIVLREKLGFKYKCRFFLFKKYKKIFRILYSIYRRI